MKRYKVYFRRSKNKFTYMGIHETLELALDYIKNYKGYHTKQNLFVKEETLVTNPFRKRSAVNGI